MPESKNVKQGQSFLQTYSWYRRFIQNFSDVVKPQQPCLESIPLALRTRREKDIQHLETVIIESFESTHKDESFANWAERGYLMSQSVFYRFVPDAYTEQAQLVPSNEITNVLKQYHDAPTAGHYGEEGTYHRIAQRYYWSGMRSSISDYVKKCPECARYKSTPILHGPAPLFSCPIKNPTNKPWKGQGCHDKSPKRSEVFKIYLILLQEPYLKDGKILGIPKSWSQWLSTNVKAGIISLLSANTPICVGTNENEVAIKTQTSIGPLSIISRHSASFSETHDTIQDISQVVTSLIQESILIGSDMNTESTFWGYPKDNPRGNAMEDFISSANIHLLNVKDAGPTFPQKVTLKAGLTSCFQLVNIFRIQPPGKFLKMLASVTIILSKFNLTLKCNFIHILGLRRPMGS
ncbi:hypothetical protein AVEN_240952-1 [Araneus ventricosus]|uniref:RNA-directed DNA polymerase n=1 Tax=Araneus ventricosus TaxID=182803 RepID=A0A4Y2SN67_ARAVE|nr:hypothetical protein AVEN_240952-1 [Araneus ventricosus]